MVEIHPSQAGLGSVIGELSILLDIMLNNIANLDIDISRQGSQIDYSIGNDLDNLLSWFDISRLESESDKTYKTRAKSIFSAKNPVTLDSIQDMFEIITGMRPVIIEDFTTEIFVSGDFPSSSQEIASFEIHFNVDITKVFELRYINPDGVSITVGHTSNIDVQTDPSNNFEAYHEEDDPTHQNDIAISLDASTSIMTLSNGPYLAGTQIYVTYEIIANPDYDKVQEIYDSLLFFKDLVSLSKAAGIKTTDVLITKFLNAWFQDAGTEQFSVTDVFFINAANFFENFTDSFQRGFDQLKFDWYYFDQPTYLIPLIEEVFLQLNTDPLSDGESIIATGTFNSIGADFDAAEIKAGDILSITAGADAGNYTVVLRVDSDTLTVTPTFTNGGTFQTYIVIIT